MMKINHITQENKMNQIEYVAAITDGLEKHSKKLRIRWMKVNKKLSIYFKTGRLIKRLKNYNQ